MHHNCPFPQQLRNQGPSKKQVSNYAISISYALSEKYQLACDNHNLFIYFITYLLIQLVTLLSSMMSSFNPLKPSIKLPSYTLLAISTAKQRVPGKWHYNFGIRYHIRSLLIN